MNAVPGTNIIINIDYHNIDYIIYIFYAVLLLLVLVICRIIEVMINIIK